MKGNAGQNTRLSGLLATSGGPSVRSYLHFTLQRFEACSTKSSDVIKSDTFSYVFIIDNYVYNCTKGTESIQEEE